MRYDYAPQTLYETRQKPCVVFHGVADCTHMETHAEYIQRFNDVGLVQVILMNMAGHPQYSGKLLSDMKENPFQDLICVGDFEARFLKLKNSSTEKGCTITNPSLYFIRHIFCDYAFNQLWSSHD